MMDAEFRPGRRPTFLSAKLAKTTDAQSGFNEWVGRRLARADQLALLKQCLQDLRASDSMDGLQAPDLRKRKRFEKCEIRQQRPFSPQSAVQSMSRREA